MGELSRQEVGSVVEVERGEDRHQLTDIVVAGLEQVPDEAGDGDALGGDLQVLEDREVVEQL